MASDPTRRQFLQQTSLLALGGTLLSKTGYADLPTGVETRVLPNVTEQELSQQSDFWEFELHFKPLRMIYVDLPDSEKGSSPRKRLVWYLCYRAINRKIERPVTENSALLAGKDPVERPAVFVPEFTLVTHDNNQQKTYIDRVIPAAQQVINQRERRANMKFKYRNSVEIVGQLPPIVPQDQRLTEENSLWGVATWRGVDPATDRFTVYMTGFSSGYKVVTTPDGKSSVLRKTIAQEFWRPSDEIDQEEREIRPQGTPKWIYR